MIIIIIIANYKQRKKLNITYTKTRTEHDKCVIRTINKVTEEEEIPILTIIGNNKM